MRTINRGMVTIIASDANIITRFDDAELVAVLANNGNVSLFAEEGDVLMQVCSWTNSTTLSPIELANKLIND